jgi:hypothetical protein
MQHGNAQTVLGNFENSKFRYTGVTTSFFKRDGKFFVNTDGPDGKLHDSEIKYIFGLESNRWDCLVDSFKPALAVVKMPNH